MARYNTLTIGVLALALAAGACNRDAKDTRKEAIKEDTKVADKAAAVEKERNDEIARLNDRVTQLERDFADKTAVLAAGKRTATSALREEVQEDVNGVKQAVANLGTTTADNWWEREENAVRATLDDVAADVKHIGARVAGKALHHCYDMRRVLGAHGADSERHDRSPASNEAKLAPRLADG